MLSRTLEAEKLSLSVTAGLSLRQSLFHKLGEEVLGVLNRMVTGSGLSEASRNVSHFEVLGFWKPTEKIDKLIEVWSSKAPRLEAAGLGWKSSGSQSGFFNPSCPTSPPRDREEGWPALPDIREADSRRADLPLTASEVQFSATSRSFSGGDVSLRS